MTKNLQGPDLLIPFSIDMNMTRADIIDSRFLIPINDRLSIVFGIGISVAKLRRLLRNDTGPGVIRRSLELFSHSYQLDI